MKEKQPWVPVLLIVLGIAVALFFVYTATQRSLTGLEGVLLQTLALLFGLSGSFWVGKQSANDAAREIIKPHAVKAFRRLTALYQSLSRVGTELESAKAAGSTAKWELVVARLDAIVTEQLATADHALEDWRDIVPKEVEALRQRLIEPQGREDSE